MSSLLSVLCPLVLAGSGLLAAQEPVPTALRLPAIVGDNMILQAGVADPIWGWAPPGQAVTVSINGQTKNATADAQGQWSLKLDPLSYGGPYEMTVQGGATLTVKNILVGEVWLCSGQSNMAMPLNDARDATKEIAQADDPQLRIFGVAAAARTKIQDDCGGNWNELRPAMAPGISAVAYFFGRKLRQELKIPIGLITSDWGGTSCETWTSLETLRATPSCKAIVDNWDAAVKRYPQEKVIYDQKMAEVAAEMAKHPEYKKNDAGFEATGLDESGWDAMKLPQLWPDAGVKLGGTLWFRRTVDLPADWVGQPLTLSLGKINNADITYVNGTQVGTSNELAGDRIYKVPATVVTGPHLSVAIKATNYYGVGGFQGPPPRMNLTRDNAPAAAPVSLAGDWKYTVSDGHLPQPDVPAAMPDTPNGAPSLLFNGMIAPLGRMTIAGAIWYQGEGNVGKADQYRTMLPAMIKNWRTLWGYDFPFLIVQLANYGEVKPQPAESEWAELQEAQLMTLSVPKTGLAVTNDIGEGDNIHYKDKQDVGVRLALWALAKIYGQSSLVYSGPLWDSMAVEGNKIRVKFREIGSGLAARDGKPLSQFSIAGVDKKFVWADAVIDGDSVVVSSPQVPNPVSVRYAWADNPAGCNLMNKEGLPASPFRTDTWPGLTTGKQ